MSDRVPQKKKRKEYSEEKNIRQPSCSSGLVPLSSFIFSCLPRAPGQLIAVPTGCGYFTPSFGNGVTIRGFNLLWGGNNLYWLGKYETQHTLNASADLRLTGKQQFVPVTVPQPFDGPECGDLCLVFDRGAELCAVQATVTQLVKGLLPRSHVCLCFF